MIKKTVFIVFFIAIGYFTGSCQSLNAVQRRLLDSLTAVVEANQYTDINSILISKGGGPVYERYFNGWTRDSLSGFAFCLGQWRAIYYDR